MFVTESYWNVIKALGLVYKSKDFFRDLFDRFVAIFIVWLINMLYYYVVLLYVLYEFVVQINYYYNYILLLLDDNYWRTALWSERWTRVAYILTAIGPAAAESHNMGK